MAELNSLLQTSTSNVVSSYQGESLVLTADLRVVEQTSETKKETSNSVTFMDVAQKTEIVNNTENKQTTLSKQDSMSETRSAQRNTNADLISDDHILLAQNQIIEIVCAGLIWDAVEDTLRKRREALSPSDSNEIDNRDVMKGRELSKGSLSSKEYGLVSQLSKGESSRSVNSNSKKAFNPSLNLEIDSSNNGRNRSSITSPSKLKATDLIDSTSVSNVSPDVNDDGYRYDRRESDETSSVSNQAWAQSPLAHKVSKDMDERRPRRETKTRKKKEDERVAIGIKISEGHANYILMYDMLTGIRVAVSRCVSKPHRELHHSDFNARHKLTFDILGNELTPSSLYDFKFKDYAPWAFRCIREHFKIEAADYLMSLTGKYILSELGSPGKSGSFFYFSQDYRFIIKTISHTEQKFLRRILHKYYEHVKTYPNTLLSRYYGLHRVKLPHGRKIHFVVMGNVFPPNKDIHDTFDLKGSIIGRLVKEEDIKSNPRVVLKDINWLLEKRHLNLGPHKSLLLLDQLQIDVNFLMEINVMDYSLLCGVHYLKRGNSENIRETSLSVFQPDAQTLARQPVSNHPASKVSTLRRVIAQSDPVQLGNSSRFPDETPTERKGCIFYQDDGGFRATDKDDMLLSELYYLGIIDILTPFNYVKRVEHAWKSMRNDGLLISAVNSNIYGCRFLEFMTEKVISTKLKVDDKLVRISSQDRRILQQAWQTEKEPHDTKSPDMLPTG